MKGRTIFFALAGLVCGYAAAQVNPRGTAEMASKAGKASKEGGEVQIDYGRPSAKGRDVLSMIEPGTYWRMGADNATRLTTEVPLVIGGTRLEKGTYTLLGRFITREEFELVVARAVEDGEPTDVAARAKGELTKGQDHVEQMTIDIEGAPEDAAIVLSWAGSRIRIPFSVAS